MATPPISKTDAELFLSSVEHFLRLGYAPRGVATPNTQYGALRMACEVVGVEANSVSGHLKAAEKAAGRCVDWTQYREAKPRVRLTSAMLAGVEPMPELNMDPFERERMRSQDRIKDLERKLKAAYREADSGDQIRQAYFGLSAMDPTVPDWTISDDVALGGPGVPMAIWSDWHWGEVVRPAEVGGSNEFNLEIAHQRLRALVARIIDLAFNHHTNPEYPGIIICLGGDMISGEIHQELAETNEMPTAPALMDLAGALTWAIGVMADHFGRVFLPCVVGNHGRNSMKPRAKRRVHTSYEYILYTMLERHFANDPRIKFVIPEEIGVHFTVGLTRYFLTHGDALGVRGGDGIIGCLGPLTRGRIKVGAAEAQIGRDFEILLVGHWHSLIMLPESGLICNGALKGYDEYARLYLQAKFQRASQAFWFDHPKVGITVASPIYLQDRAPQAIERPTLAVF